MLKQISQFSTPAYSILKSILIISSHLGPDLPSGYFSSCFPHLSPSYASHAPFHSSSYNNPYNICRGVQFMKLLVMESSPVSNSSSEGRTSLLSCLFSHNFLNVSGQVSHPYIRTRTTIVLCIVTFMFVDSRREGKRLWTE